MCTWLRPFIAELCLKSLYELETSQLAKNGHDLVDLFDRLSSDLQQELEDSYEAHTSNIPNQYSDLRDLLDAHKDHFVKWRYLHENNSTSASTILDKAIDVMFNTIRVKVDNEN